MMFDILKYLQQGTVSCKVSKFSSDNCATCSGLFFFYSKQYTHVSLVSTDVEVVWLIQPLTLRHYG